MRKNLIYFCFFLAGNFLVFANGYDFETPVKKNLANSDMGGGVKVESSPLFSSTQNESYPYVFTAAVDGDGNQGSEQTVEINVTNLPPGGSASYRIIKTTNNGNWYNSPARTLSLGLNTISVSSVAFERIVKIQVSSGEISFDSLKLNGVEKLLSQNYFEIESISVQQAVDFQFNIVANSDVQIGAFQFDIYLENSYVEFSEEPAVSLLESFSLSYNQIDNETLRVVGYTTSSQELDFTDTSLVKLQLKSLTNPGDINPNISNFIVSDLSGNEIQMQFRTGFISILGPKLYLDIDQINYGDVTVDESNDVWFNIYNNGNQDLVVQSMSFPDGIINEDNYPYTINPGNSKSVRTVLDTTSEKTIEGTISIVTNDVDQARAAQSIAVTGRVYSRNVIYINYREGIRGEPTRLNLYLENQKECVGAQLDLKVPENFSLNTNNVQLSERASDHTVNVSNIGDNTYRFLLYSATNKKIEETDGPLLSFEITPNDEVGQYNLDITNAVAMGVDQKDILSSFYGNGFNVVAPNLQVNNGEIDLGVFNSGTEQTFEIGLYNNSNLTLRVDSIVLNKDKISFPNLEVPFSINQVSGKSLSGKYKSTSIGSFEDSIIIHHNGVGSTDQIKLKGNVIAQNYLYSPDVELLNDAVDTLMIKLRNDVPLRGIQFDIEVDQNITINYDNLKSSPSLDNFTLSTSALASGKQRFLIYSTQKQTISPSDNTIFSVPVYGVDISNEGTYQVVISEIFLSDQNNTYVQTSPPSAGEISIVKDTSPVATSQTITTTEDKAVTFELIASDKDGDELTYTVPLTSSQEGEITSSGKEVTYTPKTDFFGSDEFIYEVTDGENVISDKIKIEISSLNDPPTLTNYSLSTKQDKTASLVLSSLDVDNTISQISFEINVTPSFGISNIVNDTLSYTPNNGFYGYDEIGIRSFDGIDYSETAKVFVTITKIANVTPIGVNLELATNQDEKLSIKLIGNDPEGDEITFDYTDPKNGVISSTDQSNIIEYSPNSGYFGADSFTYTVSDDKSSSSSYNVNLLIYEIINLPPVVSATNAITTENSVVSVKIFGSDPEGGALNFSISKQADNGVASFSETDLLTYVPNKDFTGSDTVKVIASDGVMSSDPTEISLNVVEAKNTSPVGISNTYTLYANSTQVITLEAYDSDSNQLTFAVVTSPSGGTLSTITNNKIEYVPSDDFSGEDSFSVKANDGKVDSTPFNINLNVLAKTNAQPTAISYTLTRQAGQTFQVTLYGLDPDSSDKDNLTYENISVSNGSLIEQSKNILTIAPDSSSQVIVKYKVSDGNENSEEATITIN